MKKLLILTGSLITAALIFTAGAYASQWLSFAGDDQIEQSGDNVEEIMQILRDVNQDKLTAEEALKELEDLNPSGLAKQNKELRERVSELEGDLNESEEVSESLRTRVTELTADNEWLGNRVGALETENGELSAANSELVESNEKLQGTIELRDRTISGLEEQLSNAADPEYVEHLESELTRANEAVEGHNTTTGEAVEEARIIGGE